MKRIRLALSAYQFIETGRDYNGRWYVAYSSGASVYLRDPLDLKRFLRIPKGLPMREVLEVWLAELSIADASRVGGVPAGVGDANVEGSFDPLAHALDDSDSQFNTKTVI